MCNEQFKSVFTTTDPTAALPIPSGDKLPPMPDIKINEKGVLKLLKDLKAHMATGPDELPARVLKECAQELTPLIAYFFQ